MPNFQNAAITACVQALAESPGFCAQSDSLEWISILKIIGEVLSSRLIVEK